MKRRDFIAGAAGAAAACCAHAEAKAGGAAQDGARFLVVSGAVAPPGVRSVPRFTSRCSACGLCISSCPGKALRAAGLAAYGLAGMMMPRLDFKNGFCSPDCHKCADVCPAEAIEKAMSPGERARTIAGVAQWRPPECITRKGSQCGLCAERCPAKAISMVKGEGEGFAHPVVDPSRCIGCGKCEYYCPAKPKAIAVSGLEVGDFAFGVDAAVAYFADGGEWSAQEAGEAPLAAAAADGELAPRFAGAHFYAKAVGKPEAEMLSRLRVKRVFARRVDPDARKTFARNGVALTRIFAGVDGLRVELP